MDSENCGNSTIVKGDPAKFEALLEKGEVLFFYKNHMDARLDNTLGEKTKGILKCCLFCRP